jgi:uncharacterized protein YkwD
MAFPKRGREAYNNIKSIFMKKLFVLISITLFMNTGFSQVEGIDIKELLTLTNSQRANDCKCAGKKQKAVGMLVWNDNLAAAAQEQAEYLIKKKSISHTGAHGSTPESRTKKHGYRWSWVGENVAKGQSSLEEVIKAWMKSPGHCRNIMNGNYTEFGAAVVLAKNGQLIWVQVFGRPAE